jgi:hypothetical protein
VASKSLKATFDDLLTKSEVARKNVDSAIIGEMYRDKKRMSRITYARTQTDIKRLQS